jgi:hypothetical protein
MINPRIGFSNQTHLPVIAIPMNAGRGLPASQAISLTTIQLLR